LKKERKIREEISHTEHNEMHTAHTGVSVQETYSILVAHTNKVVGIYRCIDTKMKNARKNWIYQTFTTTLTQNIGEYV
jgi:hypothetical protein